MCSVLNTDPGRATSRLRTSSPQHSDASLRMGKHTSATVSESKDSGTTAGPTAWACTHLLRGAALALLGKAGVLLAQGL